MGEPTQLCKANFAENMAVGTLGTLKKHKGSKTYYE